MKKSPRKKFFVDLPVQPYIQKYLEAKGLPIVLNTRTRYGILLSNLIRSTPKNKNYKECDSYQGHIQIEAPEGTIFRYGKRIFMPETITNFHNMVDDDMVTELNLRIQMLQASNPKIQQQSIIIDFMESYGITELTTVDKWARSISRLRKKSESIVSKSVSSIPKVSNERFSEKQ